MHIEKETYNEAIKKIEHDLRQHKNYKNKDIDLNKSNRNYHYGNWKPIEKFKKRINEIYIYGKDGKNKDKINYLCSIVVQYPDNCPVDEKTFFTCIVNIFSRRFGIENVISACVHVDEVGARGVGKHHLHFKFLPVIKMEKEKNGYTEKLCAKDVVNREMLKTFHEDIEKAFLNDYGIKLSLRSQEQREYINDIYEFKEAQEKNRELKEKYNYLVDLYNNALKKVISIKDYLNYQKTKERTR